VSKKMRVLVLGANGMLGNAVARYMSRIDQFDVHALIRGAEIFLPASDLALMSVHPNCDVLDSGLLGTVYSSLRPQITINCVGIVKQLSKANDALTAIPINSLLPHELARLSAGVDGRLIHISTDCVFSGRTGGYTEESAPDAFDLYGRSKLLGEVDYENSITLRTSIIGRELQTKHGLVDWFLSQHGPVKGYKNAIFSGIPTVELARVISEFVVPNASMHGVYHVSADPIAKFDLLHMLASVYKKDVKIIPDNSIRIDRSLDSAKFRNLTGYSPPSWATLIEEMRSFA